MDDTLAIKQIYLKINPDDTIELAVYRKAFRLMLKISGRISGLSKLEVRSVKGQGKQQL